MRSLGKYVVILLSVMSITSRSGAVMLGDLDMDGQVTVRDAIRLLRIVLNLDTPTPRDEMLGDVYPDHGGGFRSTGEWRFGDGQLTLADVRTLLHIAVGMESPRNVGAVIYTMSGTGQTGMTPAGFHDGPGSEALFGEPYGIAGSPSGDMYVVDRCNHAVRIVHQDGSVRTLAGHRLKPTGSSPGGYLDGPGDKALFSFPEAVAAGPDGYVYVADTHNDRIRRIAPDGYVTTYAGSGHRGYLDGPVMTAQFNLPRAVTVSPDGEVIVADDSNRIRAISRDGIVRTIAGAGAPGLVDGPALGALLHKPRGLVYAANGDLYIGDCYNGAIRRLTPDGFLLTVAGDGKFGTADGSADHAEFDAPMGLTIDTKGNVWVGDWGADTIRKIDVNGVVSTVAGFAYSYGLLDGPGLQARFYSPMSLWVAPDRRVWIADTDNQRIRVLEE